MFKKLNMSMFVLVTLLFVVAIGVVAATELDDRYVDLDGDLVADVPTDPKEWQDPKTLIFAYAPVEDPAVYEEVFAEFIEYLSEELGRPVRWFGVRSYAAQVEAMRAGRLHISGFASGAVQDAVNTAGFVPQTAMGTENGMIGYRMEIITRKDSGIDSIEDLRGKTIPFVSESSGSGYFAPRALLYEEFGMLPGRDYQVTFSGSHDNSILGVYHKDYVAAPVASTVIDRMELGGRVEDRSTWMKTVYQSPLFPVTAYGVAHNLKPELQEAIKAAFLKFDWTGTKLKEQWQEDRFVEIDYKRDWEIQRVIRSGSAAVAELLGE